MNRASDFSHNAALPPAAQQALELAPPFGGEHYDELRGSTPRALTPHWAAFFEHLDKEGFHDLNHRAGTLARQIRDNGVSYNVYADAASGPQRPWSLDLFPFIVTPDQWRHIEAGVLQRVRLLEKIMADVYGPQTFLKQSLLPAALVHGHPGYLRPMHGVEPVGGAHLHIAAFDLARGPDGLWWLLSQRTQAPSGLGYLLENRLSISRQFPQAFEGMRVQHLAATYRALMDNLKRQSPAGNDAHIALLTPGPLNETYFEHAYLARYLGLTLVEGSDLTVRGGRLYLKTLRGLEPIHALIKRLDDEYLDPLELRSDSTLGVPGLLQAIRAGNVLVANAPGAAFLESSAMLGFLPALAKELLGEELSLPALPTWWCGERASLEDVRQRLRECVIRPTYPGAGSSEATPDEPEQTGTVLGRLLSREDLGLWESRLLREGELYTVQEFLALSQTPTWRDNAIMTLPALLRVFAVSDGPGSWRVLPGGLTRLASSSAGMASMQRGGSSADTWVITEGEVDRTTLLPASPNAPAFAPKTRLVTSRSGENLYWLGRYTERAENNVRLARLALDRLSGQDPATPVMLGWLSDMAGQNSLVQPGTLPFSAGDLAAPQLRRAFERALIMGLAGKSPATSVGHNLSALKSAASTVRDRLSPELWKAITHAEAEFAQRCVHLADHGDWATIEALRSLDATSSHLAAITGGQLDRMTRDEGWRLLAAGRQIERLCFLAPALAASFASGAVHDNDGGFESLLVLFDSTITFRALHQLSHDVSSLLGLLVLDPENPRSLGCVLQNLRLHLTRLPVDQNTAAASPADLLPAPETWNMKTLHGADDAPWAPLPGLLTECTQAAWRVNDEISLRYFTHANSAGQSLQL